MALKITNLLGGCSISVQKKPGKPPKPNVVKTQSNTKQKTVIEKQKPISNTNKLNNEWIRSTDQLPEELRPILFHTSCKKDVIGYKLRNGYVTNIPYYIDKFKKKNGYIEWMYISGCSTLFNCPNEFPNCLSCKHYKEVSKR